MTLKKCLMYTALVESEMHSIYNVSKVGKSSCQLNWLDFANLNQLV